MESKQQTAVRKLINYITERGFDLEYEMEMSFLDIEKEQITYAYNNGVDDAYADEYKEMDDYYNQTYNK